MAACLQAVVAYPQTGVYTGMTISLDGKTMYYAMEHEGKSTLYRADKNSDGAWDKGVAVESVNAYVEGHAIKSPFLSYDGSTLYFSSNIPDSDGFDIYCSRKAGDRWEKPVKVPVVNSAANESSPTLSADNMNMYFTRESTGKDAACQTIYHTRRDPAGNWSYPMAIELPVGLNCENTPLVSPDGNILFFSSDRASEKRKQRFHIYYSSRVGDELWTAPAPVDSTIKEYNEYHPALDHDNGELNFIRVETGKDRNLSTRNVYKLPAALYRRPFSIMEGTITTADGKPATARITVKDAYTFKTVALHNNDSETGKYQMFLPDGRRYVVELSNETTASIYRNINTEHNTDNRRLTKDFTMFATVRLTLEIYDDFSGQAIDANISLSGQIYKLDVKQTGQGVYVCDIPLNKQVNIEITRNNYTTENISIKIPYEQQLPELTRTIRLKPGLRQGEIIVADVFTNQPTGVDLRISNLNNTGERVLIESPSTGKYLFSLRKDSRYALTMLKNGYMYFHNIWNPDISRVRQKMEVKLVPLQNTDRMEMKTLVFNADTTGFSDETLSEFDCVIAVLNSNVGMMATFSIPCNGSNTSKNIVDKSIRIISSYLESRSVSQLRYKINVAEPTNAAIQNKTRVEVKPYIQFVKR
jgi:hypothetical protein